MRDCIICIKSVIYNEMCRDAQGYIGRGTMSLDFRPLRKAKHSQPAAQAAGCFCCTAAGKLAWPTSDNGNRQEVRRTDGCE